MDNFYSNETVIFASKLQEYLNAKQDALYERLKDVLAPLEYSEEGIKSNLSLDLYFGDWDDYSHRLDFDEDNLFYEENGETIPEEYEQTRKAIYEQIMEDYPELKGKEILIVR